MESTPIASFASLISRASEFKTICRVERLASMSIETDPENFACSSVGVIAIRYAFGTMSFGSLPGVLSKTKGASAREQGREPRRQRRGARVAVSLHE
jgi:hypothetical protein